MIEKYKERYKNKSIEELHEVKKAIQGVDTAPECAIEALDCLINEKETGPNIGNDVYYPLDVSDDYQLARKYTSKIASTLKRDINFTLSFSEYKRLISAKKCYYTGVKFSDVEGMTLSLDRIDSSIGYTKENTVPALKIINAIKNALFENPNRGHSVSSDMIIKMCQKMK